MHKDVLTKPQADEDTSILFLVSPVLHAVFSATGVEKVNLISFKLIQKFASTKKMVKTSIIKKPAFRVQLTMGNNIKRKVK